MLLKHMFNLNLYGSLWFVLPIFMKLYLILPMPTRSGRFWPIPMSSPDLESCTCHRSMSCKEEALRSTKNNGPQRRTVGFHPVAVSEMSDGLVDDEQEIYILSLDTIICWWIRYDHVSVGFLSLENSMISHIITQSYRLYLLLNRLPFDSWTIPWEKSRCKMIQPFIQRDTPRCCP